MNPHDAEAEVTRLRDGRTALYKAEQAVYLDTGAIIAVTARPGATSDTESIQGDAAAGRGSYCRWHCCSRQKWGAGTPRGLHDRVGGFFLAILNLLVVVVGRWQATNEPRRLLQPRPFISQLKCLAVVGQKWRF